MSITRIRVPRLVLIEKIQESIDKEIAEHEAETAKYDKALLAAKEVVTKELAAIASTVAAFSDDEFVEWMQSHVYAERYSDRRAFIYLKAKIPMRPHALDTRYKEQSKRVLEASTDETISVSSRDGYFQYL